MTMKSRIISLGERMAEKPSTLELWSLKFVLLSLLNEVDRQLDYGHPGRAIDQMVGGLFVGQSDERPINAHKDADE